MGVESIIGGRVYRRVSVDGDPLAEKDEREDLFERLMRSRPTPAHERSMFVRTSNGNLVPRAAR